MRFLKTTLAAALTLAASHTASAHEYTLGSLTIDNPYSFATPPGAPTAAGYMKITNTGDMADRLMGVKASVSKTMIHRSEMKDGVMTMRHQMGGILIPAGGTLELKPGGYHVMFMGIDAPFKDGEATSATLIFKNAGEIDVEFTIKKRGSKAKHTH